MIEKVEKKRAIGEFLYNTYDGYRSVCYKQPNQK